jgi:hypothetical protein
LTIFISKITFWDGNHFDEKKNSQENSYWIFMSPVNITTHIKVKSVQTFEACAKSITLNVLTIIITSESEIV